MKTRIVLSSVFALTFLFSLSAQAQHVRGGAAPDLDAPNVWSQNIGRQLAASLASPTPEVRKQALHQITHFARVYDRQLDLEATVPALVSIYRTDSEESFRLAALAGLAAIGDEQGLQQIRRGLHRQSSPRVQTAALGALMAYYGSRTFENQEDMAVLAEGLIDRLAEAAPAPSVAALER